MSDEVFFKLKLSKDLRTKLKMKAIEEDSTMNEIINRLIEKEVSN